ncbi:hypothetical protein FHX42_001032 [Saccharopolyspora lacisalsi]|uniref:Uncharacterized protein n=1 Tax=Halosaccharopolyspora lacisalsi TaxID=1000566 RepID=A0A839DRK2_9PSEU|nr:hypothetical protein [Halosaccharopolyspora lacisalsi]MBA8823703.1 hypothetical protein [Halosaccharopolyspora lacisalsi]
MSRQAGAEISSDESTETTTCRCEDDQHQWSAPEIETVNTVELIRRHCTCPRCECAGRYLNVRSTDPGVPQHRAVAT